MLLEGRTRNERRHDRLPPRSHHREKQFVSILEVAVDRAARHPGTLRHFLERRPLPPFLRDDLRRRLDQTGARALPFVALRVPGASPGTSCRHLRNYTRWYFIHTCTNLV